MRKARRVNGLVVNIMRVVKGPEDYAETKGMRLIRELHEQICPMEVVYLDDLEKVQRDFEDIASHYPYYVMRIDGGTDEIKAMDTKDLWDEFKAYLNYCYDRMNPGRIVYLGNMLDELRSRLERGEKTGRKEDG